VSVHGASFLLAKQGTACYDVLMLLKLAQRRPHALL
jgi:hypothetical protein